MKRFTLGALALIAMALPASAQSWTGCYLGGAAGYSASKTDVDVPASYDAPWLKEPVSGNLLSIDGIGASGFAGGGQVGCDYQINRFVIGAFGDYLWHDQEFKAGVLDGLATTSYDIDNQWSVGGRAGILVNENTLAYGLVAYTKAETSDLHYSLGTSHGKLPLDELEGWTVGGGLETRLVGNLFLGAEYRYTKFDDIRTNLYDDELFGGGDKLKVDLDTETDTHTGLVTLKYKFGPSSNGVGGLLK